MITDKQVEAARIDLCERICAAIKAADDKSSVEADYMLDSNDCIRIVREQFAAEAAREPADYPNPGAHTPLRPAVTEQPPSADDAPIPTSEEAHKDWYVAFGARGVDLLVLSADGRYRGLANIDDYADLVRSAARTLRAFVGAPDPINEAWPDCSGDPACCPENEGYGCCKPNPADARDTKLFALYRDFYDSVSDCFGDTHGADAPTDGDPWWHETNAAYATRETVAAIETLDRARLDAKADRAMGGES